MSLSEADEARQRMGARLREAREYLGYSQEDAAKVLGVSRPAITNIESGQRKVEAQELDKLARFYGHTVAFLLTGEEEVAEQETKVKFAARALQGLSERDLGEVMRFASYLRNSSKTARQEGK